MLQLTPLFSRKAVPTLACALAVLALVFLPATAHAQLGGLVKKVIKKAADETGVNAALEGEVVKYDTITVELTPERVDRMIRGMQAGRAALAPRPGLVDKRDKVAEQLSNHLSKNGEAIASARDKRQQIQNCRDEALSEIGDKRQDNLGPQMATNPVLREKFTALATKMTDAQMKGDAAAMTQIEKEINAMFAPTAADTAAVDRNCGKVPPPTSAEQEAKSLEDQVSSLDAQIRSLEKDAAAAEAQASGFPPQVYFVAHERMEMFMSALEANRKQYGLGSNELKALNDRRQDIKMAM